MAKRKPLPPLKAEGEKVPRRGRPPEAAEDLGPLRFIGPAKALRALHTATFSEHRLQFGPWICLGVCKAYDVPVPVPGKPGRKGKNDS